jgi:aminopeptidase N
MEINNFYTATVYEKGAEVVRMLKTLIGDADFRRGMDIYFERFDGVAATVEDFLSCFAEASNRDLTQFALWYAQAGTPLVTAESLYDARGKTLTVKLSQETPPTPGQDRKPPMLVPLSLALFGENGERLALDTADATPAECARGLFELATPSRQIVFRSIGSAPVLSLLRGFSAAVRLAPAPSGETMTRLLAHDDDPFNRWQAAQSLALRAIFARIDHMRGVGSEPDDAAYVAALRRLVEQGLGDPAFTAQALALPTETDLAREVGKDVDPDVLFAARVSLRGALGLALADLLETAYARFDDGGAPYSPDAASAGRRALRNTALDLIAAGAPQKGEAMATRQFDAATNMTDRLAALAVLALLGGEARETAFARFYEQFKDDALVIDKWFALQATIPEEATTERVHRLMRRPDFSLHNPNRVRSVLGAFASGNLTRFHALDGSGYRLVVDTVLELDSKNPQLAARLLTAMRSWRTLEPRRRALAEAALKRITAKSELSRDVSDIANRSLA